MNRNLRRLTAVLSVFAYSLLSAQGTCNYSDVSSGSDNSNFVEFNSFDCVDTVANSFITEAVISVSDLGFYCPNWYFINLEVNGTTVAEDLCSISAVDLSTYGVDINNLTSVKVYSQNGDTWVDNNTISATLDLTYIVTTCPPPSGVTASNINPTTADITWSSNGSETLWNIEVVNLTAGDSAIGVATYSGVTANPYSLSGLSPETEYAIYVQSDCGPFNTTPLSDWSFAGNFITPPTCLPLGAISIDSISDTTLDLSWGQAGSETSWDIEIINTSNIPADTFTFTPTNAGLSSNAPQLTGLVPESDYQFIVRANCGVIDGPGAWTSIYYFTTLPSCQAPIDLVLGAYDNDDITFSWTAIDTETMWYVEYVNVTLGETPSGVADDSTTTTSYTAINLDANSEYQLYVSAACGSADGNSNWSGPATITTMCNPVAMPLSEPFSTWVPDCFDVDNGDQSWTPYVSAGDTIAAKARNYPNYGTNRHLITPMINMTQDALLTFKWSHDEYSWLSDSLSVRLSNDGGATWATIWNVTGAAFDSNDGANSITPGSYIEENILINSSYVGSDVLVDIAYTGPSGYGYTVFIDSIAVSALPPCNIPYYLAVDSAYTTAVDMSFTAAGTGATSYEVEVVEGMNAPNGVPTDTVSGTPFTLTGLTPGMNYSVYARTLCGSDSTAWVGPVDFTTLCAPVVDYATGFEGLNTGDVPNCWTFIDTTVSSSSYVQAYNYAFYAHTGDICVRMYNSYSIGSDQEQYMVSPEFSSLATQDHRLRFWAKDYYNDGNVVIIGTMTDPAMSSTFTPMDTVVLTNVYTQYTFNFDGYTGSDTHVAIKNESSQTYAYTDIDDLDWQEIPNCFPPTAVTVDSTSTTSVSVTIDSTSTFGTEWFIEMTDVTGTNPTVLDTAYTLSHTIDGLLASSVYEMIISTNCPDAVSEGMVTEVATECAAIGDFFTDFESLNTGNDTLICWDYLMSSISPYAYINVYDYSYYSCSGGNYVSMYNYNDLNADLLLITPELNNITAGTNLFTFSARSAYGDSPFEVGTITDANDASTFTPIYAGSVNNICDSITVPFLSYTGTDTRIAIKFNPATTYSNLYIDNVSWGPGPDCAMPVGISAQDITDVSAAIDWLNISPDTIWNLELVDVLDSLDVYDSIPTDTAYAHPYTITGLTENTLYEVFLTNPCDTTSDAISVIFETPWGNNIGVTSIISPASAACNVSDSSQIEVEIENFGGLMATGFPVELSWDDSIYFNVGTFMDTIQPGGTATFIIDGYYDFSSALDSNFWVQTALAADSVISNDGMGSSVTNLGNMWIDVQVNTGNYGGEVWWEILDTINNITAYSTGITAGYSSYSTYNTAVCVYANGDYIINAWDTYDDGWNGGTYSITRCGGIILANNDGNEVTNGNGGVIGSDLEVQEGFHVDPCPDNDLAVMSIDGLESACGLGMEVGSVTLMNFGNFDVAANGATAQYQFNNSGLWIDFWDFDTGLASQTDTVLTMPAVDMSFTGQYTIAVQIVFALDTDTSTNYLDVEVTSVPTLTEDSTTFNSDNGGWTAHLTSGVNNSWEYGTPTTPNMGTGNDQEVWATNLSGDAALNEQSYLLSPCYDFSAYTEDVELEFDFLKTNTNHTFQLQKSTNGGVSWTSVWYVTSNINDWTHKSLLVTGLAGESDVKFRWTYSSSWLTPIEGFGFDNWEAYEHVPYTDASLSDLEVNNNTVSAPVAFDPAVFDYTYEVPFGSTNYNVSATVNATFYTSITIDQISSLPDTAFVTVVAEDDAYSSTYSVYIHEAPAATDATLLSLSVSNNAVPGFDPDTLCYTMTYPYGSAFTPSVTAVANDPNATVVITNVAIPGTALITVTAQDGITVNVYCINYEVQTLSTNAFMADILTDGSSLPGFVANTYWYYVTLPNGTTTMPLITYVTADANATVNYTAAAMPLTDTAIFEVTAQDGVTMETYYVVFDEAASSNANLLDLTINGGTIAGFDDAVFIYDVELPYNSPIPNLAAITEDTTATVVIVDAPSVPGTSIVTVTAEDGTELIYYVNWSYAAANDDASLDSLITNAGYFCIIAGSDTSAAMVLSPVDENTYNLTVGVGFTSLVNLTVIPTDPNATSVISGSATVAPYGEIIITVTAQDAATQEVYTINVISDDCSVGLDEAILGQINVSPNPSNGIFYIETPADLNNYTVSVVDQIGKVVYKEVVVEATMEKVMDLSTLPAGMYNMRISTANDFIVKRISIIK